MRPQAETCELATSRRQGGAAALAHARLVNVRHRHGVVVRDLDSGDMLSSHDPTRPTRRYHRHGSSTPVRVATGATGVRVRQSGGARLTGKGQAACRGVSRAARWRRSRTTAEDACILSDDLQNYCPMGKSSEVVSSANRSAGVGD